MNTKGNELLRALFQYHRKIKKLSRKDVSLLSETKGLYLSESTIKRIESNNINNNDSSLEKYARVLSLRYEKDEFPYKRINAYKDNVLSSLKGTLTIKRTETIYEEILSFHSLYSKYVYLGEISRVLLSILEDVMFNKKISIEEQRRYEFLIKYISQDSEIATLLYYLLYKSYLFDRGNTEQNINKIKDIISKANFKKIFNMDQIRFDVYDSNLLALYNKYKNIYEVCDKNDISNLSTVVTSLFNLAHCEIMLKDYNSAEKHLKVILEIESLDKYVPNYVIYSAYNSIGFIYFNLGLFNKAIDSFDVSRKEGGNSIGFNFLLMFISLEKIEKIDYSKIIIEEELNKVKLPTIRNILEYYKLKYDNENKKVLEDHIIEHLNKKEIAFEFYSNLIYKELYDLVNETKHYKCLYEYLKKSNY